MTLPLITMTPSLWLFTIVGALLLVGMFFDADKRPRNYSNDFGKTSDLLSIWHKGLSITGGDARLSEDKSMEHFGYCSRSGGGKTTTALLGSLLRLKKCLIICFDQVDEIRPLVSGHFDKEGFDQWSLSLGNAPQSIAYNPLALANSTGAINRLSQTIVESQSGESDAPIWGQLSQEIIGIVVRIVKRMPEEFQTLPNVLRILQNISSNPKEADKVASKWADDTTFNAYKAFVSLPERMIGNVMGGVLGALQIVQDPDIERILSGSTLDFRTLRKKPGIVYINSPISDQKYLRFIQALFLGQLIETWMSKKPEEDDLNVYVFVEEAGSLKVPDFSTAISNLRKHRVSISYFYQSDNQLISLYGKEQSKTILKSTGVRLIGNGMDTETAKEIEILGGRFSYTDDRDAERSRELITASEAQQLEPGKCIMLTAGRAPAIVKMYPYFKSRKLLKRSALPPVEPKGHTPDTVEIYDHAKHGIPATDES